MRKKRKVTMTTIAKKWFLLLAITAGLVTSCKDYDDDIDGLNEDIAALQASLTTAQTNLTSLQTQIANAATDNEVTTAVNTAKQQAIDAASANVNTLLTTLKGGYTGTLKDLEDDIADVAAQLAALEIPDISGLTSGLGEAEQEILNLKEKLNLQADALAAYKVEMGDSLGAIGTQIEGILADILNLQTSTAGLAALQTAVDGFDARINAINDGLNLLASSVNSMVTQVSLMPSYTSGIAWWTGSPIFWVQQLDFSTATAKWNYVFGKDLEGAVTFEKGKSLDAVKATAYIKVSPAKAVITTDQISLIDSKSGTGVNTYVKATSVKRYDGQILTRSSLPTETGIWEVEFTLLPNYPIATLNSLIYDNGNPVTGDQILFAVAVENPVDATDATESRHILSEFDLTLEREEKSPIYNDDDDPNLSFTVDNTPYTQIRNRNVQTEDAVPTKNDMKWDNGTGRWADLPDGGTRVVDDNDMRNGLFALGVQKDKEFTVALTNPSDIYRYYVELDKDYAVGSGSNDPSEINAWNSYTYSGLNKVVKGTESVKIKISNGSSNPIGDIIGFRVHAVNYDGTPVDPDGKAFYVIVGNAPAEDALNFKATVTAPMTTGQTLSSGSLEHKLGSLASVDVAKSTFTMNLEHGESLDLSDIATLTITDAATNWAGAKKLRIDNIVPAYLKENFPYPGVLTLKNANNQTIAIVEVTLTKVLPLFADNISYKTNILRDGIIWAYPITNTVDPLKNDFNMQTALNDLDVPMYFVDASPASYPDIVYSGFIANVPTAEIGVPSLEDAAGATAKIFDAKLALNYGPVKYSSTIATGADYEAYWNADPAIKLQFRSFVQDFILNWGTKPLLKYAVTGIESEFAHIKNTPPVGVQTTLATNPIVTVDGNRPFTIVGAKALSGSGGNFDKENEYYIPDVSSGTKIEWTPNPQAGNPAGPVEHKLALDIQDEWGNTYRIIVPETITMTLH